MLYLKENQVKVLSDNGELTITLPLSQQPPEGCPQMHVYDTYNDHVVIGENLPDPIMCKIKLQFPVGKEVKCRKRISLDTEVVYAVYTTTVIANRVRPVQEVTEEEVESMGFSIVNPPPKGYFNALYAKPRLRTVDGKKQYVAWAWGWDSWEQSYGQNDKYEEYSYNGVLCQYWDKLKITVHCNPFVEIVTVNTEEN